MPQKPKGNGKVLPLPAREHAPGTRGQFISADVVRERYFADYRVRGKPASVRVVRELLKGIVVRPSPKTSGYWSKDVEEFLAALGKGGE